MAGVPDYRAGRPAPSGAYKISSNENPYPPLPSVEAALARAAESINRYPDFASSALVNRLAERFDVPAGHLAVGTGSVGVCQQIVQAVAGPGDEVIFAWRSFEAYPIIVRIAGATAIQVALADGATHDLEAMAAAMTERTRLVLVCNPNNPTGTAVARGPLEAFLDVVPSDVLVVIDEAYREFIRDPSIPDGIDLYRDRANVAVLRTFSKAYGLAGLRVGYAIAHPPVADALRKTAVPFGVSTLAQEAAIASLDAEAELLARVDALVLERDRVVAALSTAGWDLAPTHANFVWLPLGDRAVPFAEACASAGVMVRPFAGEGVRATIGEPEASDRLIEVARSFG